MNYQEALNDLLKFTDEWVDISNQAKMIQELVERAMPKKPNTSKIIRSVSDFTAEYENQAFCPNCNTRLNIKGMCCPNNDCRQKIDWSRDDNPNR